MLPVFDQFVNDGVVKDSFSMQLCGSSEIDFSSEPTVAGTMVSFSSIAITLHSNNYKCWFPT